jgi:hypothetical protein
MINDYTDEFFHCFFTPTLGGTDPDRNSDFRVLDSPIFMGDARKIPFSKFSGLFRE